MADLSSVDCVDCVCCQEVLPGPITNLTQCCLLPLCQQCHQARTSFTCGNCSAITNGLSSQSAVATWFQREVAKVALEHTKLLTNHQQLLQVNRQQQTSQAKATAELTTTLSRAFMAPNSDLTVLANDITRFSSAATKTLTLAEAEYTVVTKQLASLQLLVDYLRAITNPIIALAEIGKLLLVQQRLTTLSQQVATLPKQVVQNISLVNHRYGLSLYQDDFQAKLYRCRATVLNKTAVAPLRTIAWPKANVWWQLIGCNNPASYYNGNNPDISVEEWPQAGLISYFLHYSQSRFYLAATMATTVTVEAIRYPEIPENCREVYHDAFWLVYYHTKTKQIYCHRGLRGICGDHGCITTPTSVFIAKDAQGQSLPIDGDCFVNGDHIYINTTTGLYRKYLLDDSDLIWFSALTKVRYFHYGWYFRFNNDGSQVIGQMSWDGEVIWQEAVPKVETARIYSANTVSLRYCTNRSQVWFHNGRQRFTWPGSINKVGYFKITSQGDIIDLDKDRNIVVY